MGQRKINGRMNWIQRLKAWFREDARVHRLAVVLDEEGVSASCSCDSEFFRWEESMAMLGAHITYHLGQAHRSDFPDIKYVWE